MGLLDQLMQRRGMNMAAQPQNNGPRWMGAEDPNAGQPNQMVPGPVGDWQGAGPVQNPPPTNIPQMDPNVLMTLMGGGGGQPPQQEGPPAPQGGAQGGVDPMTLRMMLAQFERAQQAQARQPTSTKPKPLWGK